MMIILMYRLALWLGFPFIFLYLLKRAIRQPQYLKNWSERLGFYPDSTQEASAQWAIVHPTDQDTRQKISKKPLIWLHAVSVGEIRAAAKLISLLTHAYPTYSVLLTCMTPTGRATARDILDQHVDVFFLPYDYPSAIKRFLNRFNPSLCILMETELWPNLIHLCARYKIPTILANARLSQQSFSGYLRILPLIRPAVARLAAVFAQSQADAERLKQLGAPDPAIIGNMKFDQTPAQAHIEKGHRWRCLFGSRPILLIASSREGEEAQLLDAICRSQPCSEILTIIVPRHPQRFNEVANLITTHKLTYLRRSTWTETQVPIHTQVLLGDSIGEMTAWYVAADVTIIGGSLLPFGSQNLIEPCFVGTPVVLGPSTFNFTEVARTALLAGAATQSDDAEAVIKTAIELLDDLPRRVVMGKAGLAFSTQYQGATQRLFDKIRQWLT